MKSTIIHVEERWILEIANTATNEKWNESHKATVFHRKPVENRFIFFFLFFNVLPTTIQHLQWENKRREENNVQNTHINYQYWQKKQHDNTTEQQQQQQQLTQNMRYDIVLTM